MEYEALIQSSEKLMQYNDEANVKKREVAEYDFYKDMKPFVETVDEELELWKDLAYRWIKKERPKYIHVQQIDQVYDNLQTNVLQCFVNKGKGKRFFETHQAISYTLQNIVEQCK
ncbi:MULTISPECIES: YppE family protein [Bacillus]|uniref:YppE family protein n=1 Tax=Bacillus TaxID=1386 RepID=UPI00046A574C|nr:MULTISPECIES: YppE family protein [Bacillus]MED1411965.1 YppE family protein [Bacillus paramycoides]MED1465955.1 YppE family protein [Bacillus paramycoides]MED1491959.1 YppE family protein [Bacillus paramycoides]